MTSKNKSTMKSRLSLVPSSRRPFAPLLALVLASCIPLVAEKPVSIPEQIEWTWEVRPPHPDPALPNVLLLGDSISRNYFPDVTNNLKGVANVYLMASSISVGDPRLEHDISEFAAMEKVRFRIVHFNNGMHGWDYTEEQYKSAFPSYLHAVRGLVDKNGTLIWASTTPVRSDATNGASNARVADRNQIARQFVEAAGIPIDDEFSLMQQHQDLHMDSIHFNPEGAKIQAEQVTATIRTALESH